MSLIRQRLRLGEVVIDCKLGISMEAVNMSVAKSLYEWDDKHLIYYIQIRQNSRKITLKFIIKDDCLPKRVSDSTENALYEITVISLV